MSNAHAYTATEAKTLAKHFDLIAAMPAAFGKHVTAMRSVNPNLTLLTYTNGTMTSPDKASGLPESAYAHDVRGRRIVVRQFGMNLMNPYSPEWRRQAVAQCERRKTASGYDGCLVDNLTLGIFAAGGYVTAPPVVPGTTHVYTEAQYRKELVAFARYFERSVPNTPYVGNVIENAYRYWGSPVSSQPLAMVQKGSQMEDFLRGSYDGAEDFPIGDDWLRNVSVITSLEKAGKTALFTTKLWVPVSNNQVANWQRYAMGTFLLGANGHSYLAFTSSRDKVGVLGSRRPYVMPKALGSPRGPMAGRTDGTYVRFFANGLSIVNPTTTLVTVRLSSSMQDLNGQSVRLVAVPPHDATVLIGSGVITD